MDLVKILSQLDLREAQSQQSLAMTTDCFQSLNSTGGLRPDGRRLLGRSMTTTTTPTPSPSTPMTTFFSDSADDVPGEMAEVFRTHRKLDRSVSEPQPIILSTRSGSQSGSCSSPTSGSSSSRYKTELCRPFEENGSCKYGEKCQFAHGRHELRTVARHPKYKTDLCKTYHTTGLCPYGPRCHFIHNDEERYLNLVNRYLLQQQMKDSLIEKTQLVRQQQVIAAALAAQKTMLQQQQQQQQQNGGAIRMPSCSVGLISSDGTAPVDYRLQFPFIQSDQISSSISDSSSLTGSPAPSPTSSMLSDDATAAAAAAASGVSGSGSVFRTPGTQAAFGFSAQDAKLYQTTLQQQQQQQQLQLTADAMEIVPDANSLLHLMKKLQQQTEQQETQRKLDALLAYLVQKNSASQEAASAAAASSAAMEPMSPFTTYSTAASVLSSPYSPPPLFSGADYSTSRDAACFSFAYPAVEL